MRKIFVIDFTSFRCFLLLSRENSILLNFFRRKSVFLIRSYSENLTFHHHFPRINEKEVSRVFFFVHEKFFFLVTRRRYWLFSPVGFPFFFFFEYFIFDALIYCAFPVINEDYVILNLQFLRYCGSSHLWTAVHFVSHEW